MLRDKKSVGAVITAAMACCLMTNVPALADGPGDNQVENVRSVPPAGIDVPADVRTALESSLKDLNGRIEELRSSKDAVVVALLPDIEIFSRAVDQALRFNEFFNERDFKAAAEQLEEGLRRVEALKQGKAPWAEQTGLVVRGYRSRLDDTVQPYGLVIPDSYHADGENEVRCDLWFHGRFENTVELQFINQRMRSRGEIAPAGTIVLHPFGRFSNAFKFAGEVDVLEALADARRKYRIDPDRIAVRGFSMGGAGAWHFAVHYPDQFFAANPGAGFSETPDFLRVFQNETLSPPEWEQTLWNWYDCPGWVSNLRMIPTVAYSGERDRQKQAADVMAEACRKEGIELTHIIGPKMEHQIHPDSKVEIERRLDQIERQPRLTPERVSFTTYTLRHDRCDWIHVYGLDQHWKPARVDAIFLPGSAIQLRVKNINEVAIEFDAGEFPVDRAAPTRIDVLSEGDGQESKQTVFGAPFLQTDRSFVWRLHREGQEWKTGPAPEAGLQKRHGLQGPIDDAFLESFLFVTPSGKPLNDTVGQWTADEMKHAVDHWRQQMRGDVRIKNDSEVTEDDIARHNLILWGDVSSNSVLARLAGKLPLQWDAQSLTVGSQKYEAAAHVPVLVFPNPENPSRYVVLNSGFTYREYDYLNNARQTPKLPDWAVIDVREPANSRWPGKVAAAGFFNEQWELP